MNWLSSPRRLVEVEHAYCMVQKRTVRITTWSFDVIYLIIISIPLNLAGAFQFLLFGDCFRCHLWIVGQAW